MLSVNSPPALRSTCSTTATLAGTRLGSHRDAPITWSALTANWRWREQFEPRVQTPSHGASERFVVSPGHEHEGIFHMPAGQSGHPLSPYYRAGHTAWVRGEPTPFLPGRTEHTLMLKP